jgi:hypothetical protein
MAMALQLEMATALGAVPATPMTPDVGALLPAETACDAQCAMKLCPSKLGCSAEALDAMSPSSLQSLVTSWRAQEAHEEVTKASRPGSVLNETSCFNDCHARGACVSPGKCVCSRGAGLDCGSDPPVHQSGQGFIYVYNVSYAAGLENYINMNSGGDELYQAEVYFLERMMSDWSVRTLDPSKATLFYLPTLSYYSAGNVCYYPESPATPPPLATLRRAPCTGGATRPHQTGRTICSSSRATRARAVCHVAPST